MLDDKLVDGVPGVANPHTYMINYLLVWLMLYPLYCPCQDLAGSSMRVDRSLTVGTCGPEYVFLPLVTKLMLVQ